MTTMGSIWIPLLLAAGACLSMAHGLSIAAPVNKCVVDGTVTFQHGPCPSSLPRSVPSTQELNAQEKRRRATSVPAKPASPASAAVPPRETASTGASDPRSTYRCDGRQYCSQMRSCAEAKFFLANCPAVKMDGDKDGVPCEEQWCRP